jgi:hypothetical protein
MCIPDARALAAKRLLAYCLDAGPFVAKLGPLMHTSRTFYLYLASI